ncbi:MAG: riboflavin synthase [Bacilli bacterium]|nr:riboflavin synthase [Bacilli bacterium]
MFTGLVEDVGHVQDISRSGRTIQLTIRSRIICEDLKLGDSVSVNGACLTAVHIQSDLFTADAVPETVRRTNLAELRAGDPVNLERALRLGDRIGGHLVAGHVDDVGHIVRIQPMENARVITIQTDPDITRYIVEKGSITVDGVSLTVMDVSDTGFRVSLIPHSADRTLLGRKQIGAAVNLETDLLAKYIEKLMQPGSGRGVSMDLLRENGFL